jgi:Leucine-rich repeat (LRR) protein
MKYIKTYEIKTNKDKSFSDWLELFGYHEDMSIEIDCSYSNLIDLNGIEKFINIEALYCEHNKLTELHNLSNLINLKELYCNDNKLTELSDLSNLTNLEYLHCDDNKLTELPDLSNLTNLKELYCYNNKLPYNDLDEYLEWHKKIYPWIWNAKKYNM